VQPLAKLTYTSGLRYIPTAVSVTYDELRKSRCESLVKIYAGNSGSGHRLCAETVRKNVHVVTEVSEAEIGYQRRAERIVEPGRNAVVARLGLAGKASWTEALTAGNTKGSFPRKIKPLVAVPTEDMQFLSR